jgi:hypothetical protein
MLRGMKQRWMRVIASAAGLVAGGVGGCEQVEQAADGIGEAVSFKGGTTPGKPIDLAAGWPFAPESMRVHPFTSIGLDARDGALMLEARVELLDAAGDVTKGVGEFRFELYADHAAASRRGQDQQLNRWEAPLRTLEQNAQHYDPITRTYLFKLRLDPPPPTDQRLKLVAQFTDPTGRRLRTDGPVSHRTDKK